jgi:cell division protein FtsB
VKVTEYLQRLGVKAGLLHIEEKEQAIDTGVFETRVVSLSALLQQQDETLAEPPAELTLDFRQIFDAVKEHDFPHGWNVDRVSEFLKSDACRNLPHAEQKKALLEALGKEGIPADDVVKDALSRDRALDSYQDFLAKKLKLRGEAIEERINELQKQIEESRRRIEQLKSSVHLMESGYQNWIERKTRAEEDMVAIVSLIAEGPQGITVTHKEKK